MTFPDLLTDADLRDRILNGRPRRRFIIPGVLPAGPSILFGASGLGKTGVAIATAIRVASGTAWAGYPVEHGAVLYLAGEDFHGVEERLVAASLETGLQSLPYGLAEPPDGGMATKGSGALVGSMAEALADKTGLPVSLVVIDTLAASFGPASQDDASAASIFMNEIDRLARSLDCAVLAIHHTGKAGSDMRGSQVFFDRADAVLRVAPMRDRQTLRIEKMRNAPDGGAFGFRIDAREIPTASRELSVQIVPEIEVLAATSRPADAPKEARRTDADMALDALCELVSDAQKTTIAEWRDACWLSWREKPSEDARRRAFSTARKALVKNGKIRVSGKVVSVSVSEKSAYKSLTDDPVVSVSVSAPPPEGEGAHSRTHIAAPKIGHEARKRRTA